MNEQEFERLLKKKEKRIKRLEKEKKILEKEKDVLQERVCELEKRLLAYENAHTPPSLSKKRKKRIPRESSGKLGAPKGHPKYEREEPEIDEEIRHTVDTCPYCNCKLDIKEILEVLEEEIPEMKKKKAIKHFIEWAICPNCKRRVVAKNNAPADRFGPNLKSKITLLKHDDRLPLRKVELTLLRDHDFKITHTGIMKVIRQVAKKLREPYYEIIKEIRSSKVAYIDETQYKLNGDKWWLWTFVCKNAVLFTIRKSRSKEVVEEILGKKYDGIIVCDGWKTYESFSNKLQRCWAHLLRESYHLKEKYSEFERYHKFLKKLFERIKEIRLKPPGIEKRRESAEKMKKSLMSVIIDMKKNVSFNKFAEKIQNGMDYWFTCVEHLEVEPTNNYAEQALRELIVQRKIMGGLRSKKGAETLEVISTMIATWKKQDKPLLITLKGYLE
jgi:transposase